VTPPNEATAVDAVSIDHCDDLSGGVFLEELLSLGDVKLAVSNLWVLIIRPIYGCTEWDVKP
jgi:hypothetical protein